MNDIFYLAYGSNLNLKQMTGRCPNAKVVGASQIKNYRLLFRGGHDSAVATIEPAIGEEVPVLIRELTRLMLRHLTTTKDSPSFTVRRK